MHKNMWVVIIVSALVLGAGAAYYMQDSIVVGTSPTPDTTQLVYTNTEYGFTFALPDSWQGYTIVPMTWVGLAAVGSTATSGLKILIRNPHWTASEPYEDLPLLIFTLSQWQAYMDEEYAVSSAPVPATELARNEQYVFALPPRWDFDYSRGYEEAQAIIASKPIRTFAITGINEPLGKLNINLICEQSVAAMTFVDATSAEAFVADCKEGKHPEVIEKYTEDLKLREGVAL
jgi:hypothetical protein